MVNNDDNPARDWAEISKNWPYFVIPEELLERARNEYPKNQWPRHIAHMRLCEAASIPHGSYVSFGPYLRIETEEMLERAKILSKLI